MLLLIVAVLLVWSSLMMIVRAVAELRNRSSSDEDDDPRSGRGDLNSKTVVRESVLGFVIGLMGGAVGLALGVLRMPALVHVLKMKPSLAAGTNLALTILVGTSGFTGHLISGRVDWLLVSVIGIPAMIGMFAGSRMTGTVDAAQFRLVWGIVFLSVSPLVFSYAILSLCFLCSPTIALLYLYFSIMSTTSSQNLLKAIQTDSLLQDVGLSNLSHCVTPTPS